MTKITVRDVCRFGRVRVAMFLAAAAAAASMMASSAAAAQEACYGPHASYESADDQCLYLTNIEYCLRPPAGYSIIRQDDLGYLYCCCLPVNAAQPGETEVAAPEQE
jgi:hypothetical protein